MMLCIQRIVDRLIDGMGVVLALSDAYVISLWSRHRLGKLKATRWWLRIELRAGRL